jgi:hypothetical protein
MLRDLGAAFYATQTGRTTPTTEADMQRLVSALQQHESEHGALTLAPESSAAAPTAAPTTAGGDDAAPASPPPPAPPKAADPSSPPPPPPTAQTL